MTEVSTSAIDSLTTKMQSLDLSTDELAVLDALLCAAEAASEVQGFEFKRGQPLTFGLPDLRGRLRIVIEADQFRGKGTDPHSVVINHEEQ